MLCIPDISAPHRAITHAQLRILVAHPFPAAAQTLHDMLQDAGYLHVHVCTQDKISLDYLQQHPCDVLLLEWAYEHQELLALCHALMQHPHLREIIVLALCHSTHLRVRRSLLSCGVSDILIEPINRHELVMRIEMHWQQRQMTASLRQYHQRTQHELDIARQMHHALLPNGEHIARCSDAHHIHIDQWVQTASEIGGDLWGLRETPQGRLGIFLVDFTGHGVGAAINCFRLHTLLHTLHDKSDQPADYCMALNHMLCEILPPWQFATFFYGVWNHTTHTLTYAAAACPTPVIAHPNGRCTVLDTTALPLGIAPDSRYEAISLSLMPTEHLLLYSDALVESGKGGDMSNELEGAWLAACHARAQPDIPTLLERLHFDSRYDAADDLTLVTLSPQAA